MISPTLRKHLPQRGIAENFEAYEGQRLVISEDAVLPDLSFLATHRGSLFVNK
jgi:hypothetical protein